MEIEKELATVCINEIAPRMRKGIYIPSWVVALLVVAKCRGIINHYQLRQGLNQWK